MQKDKKYFFGWTNIKWFIREMVAMYSNTPSYFSKKRFESSIAFMSAIGVMLSYIYFHRLTITNSEILSDVVILLGIAGYTVSNIEKEKRDNKEKKVSDSGVSQDATKKPDEVG